MMVVWYSGNGWVIILNIDGDTKEAIVGYEVEKGCKA